MLAALQPKKGKFLLVFDVTQTTVHNTEGGQTSTTSKEDAPLDLGYRESGNPQYCGILLDNDAGTAGILQDWLKETVPRATLHAISSQARKGSSRMRPPSN